MTKGRDLWAIKISGRAPVRTGASSDVSMLSQIKINQGTRMRGDRKQSFLSGVEPWGKAVVKSTGNVLRSG